METRRRNLALKKAQQALEIQRAKPSKSEERAIRAKVREANKAEGVVTRSKLRL